MRLNDPDNDFFSTRIASIDSNHRIIFMTKSKPTNTFEEVKSAIISYFLTPSFSRFCAFLVLVGLASLGIDWADVILVLADKSIPDDGSKPSWVPLANYGIPVLVVLIGIALRLWVFKRDENKIKSETSKKRRSEVDKLIGCLRVICNLYSIPSNSRDSGYGVNERLSAQNAAKKYLKHQDSGMAANRVLRIVAEPVVDGDQNAPYFEVSVGELEELIQELKDAHEIK